MFRSQITPEMSDGTILKELGNRLKRMRLNQRGGSLTQTGLAELAGLSRGTVSNLEQGKGKLENLIPILRALGELEILNDFLRPASQISPIEAARMQGKIRVRASATGAAKPPVTNRDEDNE